MDRKFENLIVWQKSKDLIITTYNLLNGFPEHERYAMRSQLQRAVNSICANIAEGTGRRTEKDFLNFLYIAKGSLEETKNFFIIAAELGYINSSDYKKVKADADEIGKILNGLIKSLLI